jgi:hypothetical protein
MPEMIDSEILFLSPTRLLVHGSGRLELPDGTFRAPQRGDEWVMSMADLPVPVTVHQAAAGGDGHWTAILEVAPYQAQQLRLRLSRRAQGGT